MQAVSSALTYAGTSQSAIVWPDKYTPGETDNWVCNERIVKGISAKQIWDSLSNINKWESYYKNCQQITPPSSGPELNKGDEFKFSTFGFPPLDCTVRESVAPGLGQAGRIAWEAVSDGVAVYHAWLVEDLSGDRVRILTQESQIGEPFHQIAEDKPNVMLLGHQDWIDGLVKAARNQRIDKTNLGAAGKWERQD